MRTLNQEEIQDVSAGQTLNSFFVTEQLSYSNLCHLH